MSEVNQSQTEPDTSAEQPEQAQKTEQQKTSDEPTWLPKRLEEAKRSAQRALLEQYGVRDPKELESKLAKLAELETASLTDQERAQKEREELQAKASAGERYKTSFTALVDREFQRLTESQREVIDRQAGGDPERRWQLMELAAAFAAPAQPGQQRPNATTTKPDAERAPAPVPSKTPFDTWTEMRAHSPQLAALFYSNNTAAVEKTRPSQ
jgi:hypothetical protein